MSSSFRCPSCGALNPAGAEWCGQCLTRFAAPTPPPPPPPPQGEIDDIEQDPLGEGAAAPAPAGSSVTTEQRGPFKVTAEGIIWTCTRCETENPLEAPVCSVCGARFAEIVQPPVERPVRDPNTVALFSLFFPGAGHWYLGLKSQAVARAVLSSWVFAIAILAGVAGSPPMAVAFLVAAFGLWAATAHDAFREARNETDQVLLTRRVFISLVLGLLMLLGLQLVWASMRALNA